MIIIAEEITHEMIPFLISPKIGLSASGNKLITKKVVAAQAKKPASFFAKLIK